MTTENEPVLYSGMRCIFIPFWSVSCAKGCIHTLLGAGHHKRTSSSSAFSLTDEPVQGEGFDEEEAKSLIDWARENCCDALKIIIEYHRCRIPRLGETLHFASLTHLDDLLYTREEWETTIPVDSMKKLTHKRSLPGEEAHVLQDWCIATICRVMSLENILSLLLNTVLEKQIVLLCPKLGMDMLMLM